MPSNAVDLVNHAIDLIAKCITPATDIFVVRETAIDTGDDRAFRTGFQTPLLQLVENLAVPIGQCPALREADRVEIDIQRALGCQLGIKLSQAAGGRVAWIDESFFAGFARLLVISLEPRLRHEHLTANLQCLRISAADQP